MTVTQPVECEQGIDERISALDWTELERGLEKNGFAKTNAPLLSEQECRSLIEMYDDDTRFRSRIQMERFRFGAGEYKYFANPLPELIESIRREAYRRLAPLGNRWSERLGGRQHYPSDLDEFLDQCHTAGQNRPTPLLLKYKAGDFNCLHQDIYGNVAFPVQITCVLNSSGVDYEGGEFLLIEQRPRSQSRGTCINIQQGELIIFPNSLRPMPGGRGYYKSNMRHGVSTVTAGNRFSLGIIFHDAK